MTGFLVWLSLLSIQWAFAENALNSVEGEPLVQCGPDSIEIQAKTKFPFTGTVYVKNWRKSVGCYKRFENNATLSPSYSLSISEVGKCGLETRRAGDKTMEIFAIVVFGFHPNFMTQNDRSFAVHCVFTQQNKDVHSKISLIRDIPSKGVASGVAQLPMPRLKVISGRVPDENLEAAKVVTVGEALIFVWYFADPSDIYGFTVRECTAETLDGRKMEIITSGCTIDEVLISDIKHSEHNDKAFADGMAFKFPDSEDMWIKCKLDLCLQNHEHFNVTEEFKSSICSPQSSCHSREKRSADKRSLNDDNILSVNQKIRVVDKDVDPESHEPSLTSAFTWDSKWCFMKNLFSVFSVLLVILYSCTVISLIFFYVSARRNLKRLPETCSSLH
ncbi:unnamed protein product [Bursaphelenchus xylophilus]|uniref:(pine wood nematode) hypothetical protein n=1 Tax=Bursaphelenchus xylophilus TaxID=6326 RepID=A0A1I7SQK3_BURXY|nr:unnamed protein product [Bursaphelenchus xylophilus]CAG9110024.1 unnamed protein product [Bursaphelenchus xylophilus]